MFITSSDFRKVYENVRSDAWCFIWYRNLRAAYGLDHPRKIPTIKQFCEYMALDEQDVRIKLGWEKQKSDLLVK